MGNGLAFGMVGLAGMLAAALRLACLRVQAGSVGLFGQPSFVLGVVVAIVLLGAPACVPIVAFPIWDIGLTIGLMRDDTDDTTPRLGDPTAVVGDQP